MCSTEVELIVDVGKYEGAQVQCRLYISPLAYAFSMIKSSSQVFTIFLPSYCAYKTTKQMHQCSNFCITLLSKSYIQINAEFSI